MPYSDNQYLDPLHIVWRKGTVDDPYVDRVEYLKVVNQMVVLSEIPDKFHRVKILGMEEVNVDKVTHSTIQPNQFSVNYSLGVIQLHSSKEAETVNVIYKGRGFIQYPSSRIYHQDEMGGIVKSLDEIVRQALETMDDLVSNVDDKIKNYQSIRDMLLEKLVDIKVGTDNAKYATEQAQIATEKALDAFETTRLVFMPYVQRYAEIGVRYPSPKVGWTVQVYDTGIRYRYDGITWIPIDLFGGNIPIASERNDGLMSKETFSLLKEIDQNYDKVKPNERIIVFCFPYLNGGANSIIARFPYKGVIQSIKGICSKSGADTFTEIDIEKSMDMTTWTSVFNNSFLTFNTGSHFDNGNHSLLATGVSQNEMFRVNVRTLSQEIEGVTIEIKIEVQ